MRPVAGVLARGQALHNGGTDAALFVGLKAGDRGLVDARVAAEQLDGLLLAVVGLGHARPFRPGVGGGARGGRGGHHLELGHAFGPQPQHGADAVVAGVAAAHHQHPLAFGELERRFLKVGIQQRFGHGAKEIHREPDALGLPPRHGQVARAARAAGQQHAVVLFQQFRRGLAAADVGAAAKPHPGALHGGDAPVDNGFVQLHVGDAVAQQPAGAVGFFVHGHAMAAAVEQPGRRQPGRAAAHHRHRFAGAHGRGRVVHQAVGEGVLHNGALVLFGADSLAVLGAGAGGFAQSGADAASELRQAVGALQPPPGPGQRAAVYKVVCLGDQVMQRAAGGHTGHGLPGLAERHAAVHAAGGLAGLGGGGKRQVEFVKILQPLPRRPLGAGLARILQKAGGFAHGCASFMLCAPGWRRTPRPAPVRPVRPAPRTGRQAASAACNRWG